MDGARVRGARRPCVRVTLGFCLFLDSVSPAVCQPSLSPRAPTPSSGVFRGMQWFLGGGLGVSLAGLEPSLKSFATHMSRR